MHGDLRPFKGTGFGVEYSEQPLDLFKEGKDRL